MRKYSIKNAVILLVIVTIVEKVLGFGREMVIASQFGATGLTDSYIGGYLIPNFIMVILNAGLVNVYAPIFLSENEIDEDGAWDKINSISTYLMIVLIFIVFLGIVFSSSIVQLLYPGFNQNSVRAATSISRIFFIGVFIYSASIIEGSLLNCFRYFIYPVISVSLLSIGIIVWVLVFGGKTNINSIAYGYLIGALAGFIVQYLKLKQIKGKIGINFTFYRGFVSKFFYLLFPVLVTTSMGQINVFVDRIFASYLPSGSMSYLTYADKVTQLPIVFSGIIATIIFPDLIQYINDDENEKLKIYINKALVITMAFIIPAFVGLVVLNREVISILFERNAFDRDAAVNTASALFYFSPTIIMYGGMAVIAKVYYSLKDTVTLMYISITTIALNALFNYLLMKSMYHNGLALSTSIVSVIQFIAAYFLLKKKVNISMGSYISKNIFKISIASILMGVVVYSVKSYYIVSTVMASFIVSIIAGVIIYVILIIVLRVDEIKLIISKFKLSRKKGV